MRGLRFFSLAISLTVLGAANVALVDASPSGIGLSAPRTATAGSVSAVAVKLPSGVAAVDGRLVIDPKAAELIGVAPSGSGTAFAPVALKNGFAFGAYGLRASGTTLHLVILPKVSGVIGLRVVIDAAADSDGNPVRLTTSGSGTVLQVGNVARTWRAPDAGNPARSIRPAGAIRGLTGAARLGKQDLDVLRSAWEFKRLNGQSCAATPELADANGDGCVDIVDAQALLNGQSQPAVANPLVPKLARPTSSSAVPDRQTAAVRTQAISNTFVVNTTADAADSSAGNGICADSQGRCTLRAAITESNWSSGEDLIQFNISGSTPVRIVLGSLLPHINDRSGGVTIDGYSQPGARVNSATFGSNAIPGVEVVGTGNSPRGNILRVTSAGNTIRGLILNTADRPIALSGVDANNNRIIGNWIGFDRFGAPASYWIDDGIYLDGGPKNNVIGTADLADRNVIGQASKAIFLYGAGTDGTIIQNNVLCMTPSGNTAMCYTGIDHDFGPKNGLIGGSGNGERNYFGGSYLNGVEYSHGWDPATHNSTTKWQVNGNRVIGNWIGFRADGSYSAAFRSGQNSPGSGDNGNGINIYDGANYNVAEANYVGSAYDGVRLAKSNATHNTVRNNVIGESPLGQAAPMAWWGVRALDSTVDHLIEGNIIRNAVSGGIGLNHSGVRRVRITRNIVTNTNGPAIRLQATANGSSGANNLYPAPAITAATTIAVSGTGIAGSTVEVYRASLPAGQSGLPVAYLGSGTVAGNGTWSVNISLAQSERVTALQIAPNGNTSTLGTNVTATFQALPPAPVANFSATQQQGNRTIDFSDTSSNAPTSWSWTFGDGGTSSAQNPSHTYATAGTYSVTLTASNAGGSSSATSNVVVSDPPAGTIYASDSFGRSVGSGWGNAETGGAYTISGTASNFSVNGATGTMTVPAQGTLRSAILNGVTARDMDMTVAVSVDKLSIGGNQFVYLVSRRVGSNEYRPKLRIAVDGSVYVSASRVINGNETAFGTEIKVAGLLATPGAVIRVGATVTGASPTTVSVKAWADGTAEPSSWQYVATDSTAALQSAGSMGLRVFIGGNVTNAPHRFTFDDFAVRAP